MNQPIENVPAWGNAALILNDMGVKWDYAIVDQITKRDCFGYERNSDGFSYHFMVSGYYEVAQWSPVFNKIFFFEPHRMWAEQFVAACRHLGYNNPPTHSYIKA